LDTNSWLFHHHYLYIYPSAYLYRFWSSNKGKLCHNYKPKYHIPGSFACAIVNLSAGGARYFPALRNFQNVSASSLILGDTTVVQTLNPFKPYKLTWSVELASYLHCHKTYPEYEQAAKELTIRSFEECLQLHDITPAWYNILESETCEVKNGGSIESYMETLHRTTPKNSASTMAVT
jgi:hypothetical protein